VTTGKSPDSSPLRRPRRAIRAFGSAIGDGVTSRRKAPNARDNTIRFLTAVVLVLGGGALLLWLPWTDNPGKATSPVDAIFTAVAAFTGTFAVVDTAEHWSLFGKVVILLLIQVGGLGFMVGASLLLTIMRTGRGSTSLHDAVVIRDGSPALTLRDAGQMSRAIIRYTIVVELIGALILGLRFSRDMPFSEAMGHGIFVSVSAFCNAGFDLSGGFRSLEPYQSSYVVNFAVIALIQAGALSYLVFNDLVRSRRWSRASIDTRIILIGNGFLLAAGTVIIFISEWGGIMSGKVLHARVLISIFQSASARSAGFQTVDLSSANDGTLFAYTGLMFIGGAPGSTAGGVKLTVAGVILISVIATLRGESEVSVMTRSLPYTLIARAIAITVTMGLSLFLVALMLTGTEHLWGESPDFVRILFDSTSALGSSGLSSGIIPTLSSPGKVVLCVAMIFGKLGPLTLAYALQRRQSSRRYTLPETTVRMG